MYDYHAGTQDMGCNRTVVVVFLYDDRACSASRMWITRINIKADKNTCYAFMCSYRYEHMYDYHAGTQDMGYNRTVVVVFQ